GRDSQRVQQGRGRRVAADLARKYRVMLELRAANAGNESRAELRALATGFPGVLRELDSMAAGEIARRPGACERAAAGGARARGRRGRRRRRGGWHGWRVIAMWCGRR